MQAIFMFGFLRDGLMDSRLAWNLPVQRQGHLRLLIVLFYRLGVGTRGMHQPNKFIWRQGSNPGLTSLYGARDQTQGLQKPGTNWGTCPASTTSVCKPQKVIGLTHTSSLTWYVWGLAIQLFGAVVNPFHYFSISHSVNSQRLSFLLCQT